MTTDVLRNQVVEAMAQAMWIAVFGGSDRLEGARWEAADERVKAAFRFQATAALDAALDVLGEQEAGLAALPPARSVGSLLAVLRAGKGSDE